MASVAPTTRPPLTPPPAIHIVKPRLWWSRPLPDCASGDRPNSPPHSTSVESSRPRRFRSQTRPATRNDADETHPLFHELPRQKTAPAIVVGGFHAHAVQVERFTRFT